MPIDPDLLEILACPACKTPVVLVHDGQALKCDQCHRVYPDQGRHPGHADRRGHDREVGAVVARARPYPAIRNRPRRPATGTGDQQPQTATSQLTDSNQQLPA
jgi:hypothetical protein